MSILNLIVFLLGLTALTFYFRREARREAEAEAEEKDREKQGDRQVGA